MEETGLIFDIQGHSVHDGPGSRTLVFLSGCPLRCEWCSNPEGMELRQRIRFREKNCVTLKQDCTRCADACPYNAITFNRDNEIPLEIDRQLCRNCDSLDCAKACLKEALIISGKKMTVTELMTILNRDRQFWGRRAASLLPAVSLFFRKGLLYRSCKNAARPISILL